jgi:hypothetical protein
MNANKWFSAIEFLNLLCKYKNIENNVMNVVFKNCKNQIGKDSRMDFGVWTRIGHGYFCKLENMKT